MAYKIPKLPFDFDLETKSHLKKNSVSTQCVSGDEGRSGKHSE